MKPAILLAAALLGGCAAHDNLQNQDPLPPMPEQRVFNITHHIYPTATEVTEAWRHYGHFTVERLESFAYRTTDEEQRRCSIHYVYGNLWALTDALTYCFKDGPDYEPERPDRVVE